MLKVRRLPSSDNCVQNWVNPCACVFQNLERKTREIQWVFESGYIRCKKVINVIHRHSCAIQYSEVNEKNVVTVSDGAPDTL